MTEQSTDPQRGSFVAGILAGGKSTRLGLPKALIELPTGMTIIERAYQVVSKLAEEVVLLGRFVRLPEALAGLPVLEDAKPDGGPLAGLCSLLEYANTKWALLVACDMPHLDTPIIRKLIDHADPDCDAVVFERMGQSGSYHACCALYHRRIVGQAACDSGGRMSAPPIQNILFEGDASLHTLLKRIRVRVLQPTPEEARQLANVNTPEDLAGLDQR